MHVRRLVAALAVATLSSAGFFASTGSASADTSRNALVQECQAISQISLGNLLGACVSALNQLSGS